MKRIGEPIRWRCQSKRHQRFRFEVNVVGGEHDGIMRLVGYASPSSWSYVLLGPRDERIRKISNPKPGHMHPDRTEADPHHKHYWDPDYDDLWTYVPKDIRWDDHNTVLIDFVAECKIEPLHQLPTLAFQATLPEESRE
ncbi:MAG: hypothetical protein KDA52_18585 [Planctomycetaceae bacterium]|nr:hypothetical protein [Planctomycetaceae bacterium]